MNKKIYLMVMTLFMCNASVSQNNTNKLYHYWESIKQSKLFYFTIGIATGLIIDSIIEGGATPPCLITQQGTVVEGLLGQKYTPENYKWRYDHTYNIVASGVRRLCYSISPLDGKTEPTSTSGYFATICKNIHKYRPF